MKIIACKPVAAFAIVGLLFIGCSSPTVENVGVAEALPSRVVKTDSVVVGNDRLVLQYTEYDIDSTTIDGTTIPGSKGLGFHSIVWQRHKNGEWIDHLTIDESDFQRNGCFPWVTTIHSFDPAKATAVLEIGELSPPDNTGTETASYTWREWDLHNNKEIRLIDLESQNTVYACPMCEEQQLKTPGKCPICEMQLQPTLGPLTRDNN